MAGVETSSPHSNAEVGARAGALAVLTPFIGLPSETFIRRHIEGLAPERTIAVTTSMEPPAERVWSVDAPVVRLTGRNRSELSHKARNAWARARNEPTGRWRWEPAADDLELLKIRLREFQVTAVLVEYLDVFLPLLPALRDMGLRIIGHGHGVDVSARLRSEWWSERYRSWNLADALVTVSEHSRRRLVERCHLDSALIHVIPCGVDIPSKIPEQPLSEGGLRLIAVGRLVPKKNPLATIEAFRLASQEVEGMTLTMVGDGPLLPDVRAAVEQDSLHERIRLLGAIDHTRVLELMSESHVFVQHSVTGPNGDEEGLSVGVLEAMSRGLAVVSTRHAGIPEAVETGVTGLLVEEFDVGAMASALVTLARDPDRRRAYGQAGRARAEERFSWSEERRQLRKIVGLDTSRR